MRDLDDWYQDSLENEEKARQISKENRILPFWVEYRKNDLWMSPDGKIWKIENVFSGDNGNCKG